LPSGCRARLLTQSLTLHFAPDALSRAEVDWPKLQEAASERQLCLIQVPPDKAELTVTAGQDSLLLSDIRVLQPGDQAALACQAKVRYEKVSPRVLVEAFAHAAQYQPVLRTSVLAQEPQQLLVDPNSLEVKLIVCTGLKDEQLIELDENPHEFTKRHPSCLLQPKDGRYWIAACDCEHTSLSLCEHTQIAFWLWNLSPHDLFVSLLDCNASGQVDAIIFNQQLLRKDARGKVFWDDKSRYPFRFCLTHNKKQGIDRLIAVAAGSGSGCGLDSLPQSWSLQQVIDRAAEDILPMGIRNQRDLQAEEHDVGVDPEMLWTAVMIPLLLTA
jgi:hypothetical protein